MAQGQYKTRQRELVYACMADKAGEFLSVDEVFASLMLEGHDVGRTTVYRTLEKLHAEGRCSKVPGRAGGPAKYMIAHTKGELEKGRLCCLECGAVEIINCTMLRSFEQHVQEHHGFRIDESAAAIYGTCKNCQLQQSQASGGIHDR